MQGSITGETMPEQVCKESVSTDRFRDGMTEHFTCHLLKGHKDRHEAKWLQHKDYPYVQVSITWEKSK